MRSRILHGETWHRRFRPRKHSFRYRMFWLLLDLDELAALDGTVTGFGHNRRAWASVHDRDYAGPGPGSIRAKIRDRLREGGVVEPMARIMLCTLPRVCGYVFNPVSFYFCYRPDEALAAVVAEVRNTFGEVHHYVLTPEDHPRAGGESTRYRAAKNFYVSPFLEVSGGYEVVVSERDGLLRLQIHLEQHGQRVFTAGMTGRAVPLGGTGLVRTLVRFPFLAATIMLRIHWQALQLGVRRRLPVFVKPAPAAAATFAADPPSFWHRLRASFLDRAVQRHKPRP
ncbi:MAG: DUF1365 domain-containing protein [Phycisphaerales bacterium]